MCYKASNYTTINMRSYLLNNLCIDWKKCNNCFREKPLSYLDLTDVFGKLLDDKTAEESTADIPDKRERFFMWYRNFRLEDHIEEYVVEDKAWEWQKFKKTGNVYDLK